MSEQSPSCFYLDDRDWGCAAALVELFVVNRVGPKDSEEDAKLLSMKAVEFVELGLGVGDGT